MCCLKCNGDDEKENRERKGKKKESKTKKHTYLICEKKERDFKAH